MDGSWFSLLDMAIVGVPALVIGVWQLVSVNREIAKDKQAAERARMAESALPRGSGHPVGEHRLDDR